MSRDPETFAHQEWLGYVQPVGLVVSIPALLNAQAHVNRNIAPDHQRFLSCLPRDKDEPIPEIRDFPEFTRTVLGWEAADLLGAPGSPPLPADLEVTLPEYHETLRPTYAVKELPVGSGQWAVDSGQKGTASRQGSLSSNDLSSDNVAAKPRDATDDHPLSTDHYILLIQSLPGGTSLDEIATQDDRHWQATPHYKFERFHRTGPVFRPSQPHDLPCAWQRTSFDQLF